MKNIVVVLVVLMSMLTLSCTSPLNSDYKEDSLTRDKVRLSRNVTPDEFAEINLALIRNTARGTADGKTYRRLLEEGKQIREKMSSRLAYSGDSWFKEAERIETLNSSVTVTCVEKEIEEWGYSEYLTIALELDNGSGKDIRAIKGKGTFRDMFGDAVYSFNYAYDDTLSANHYRRLWIETRYNSYEGGHKQLKEKALDQFEFIWESEAIVFVDGSVLK